LNCGEREEEDEAAAGVLSLTFAFIALSLPFSLSSQDVDRALAFFEARRRGGGVLVGGRCATKSGNNSWQRLEKLENSGSVRSINQWSVLISFNHTKAVPKIYILFYISFLC